MNTNYNLKPITDFAIKMKHQMLELNKSIQPAFHSISETALKMSELGKTVKKYIDDSGISESLSKLRKRIIETEEDLKVFKALMVEMGYPPHSGIEISTMRSIAQSYESNKEVITSNVIDDFMFKYYSPEKIKLIAVEWENNNLLKERLSILRNVVMAHNLGLYNVAIPTLLSQLEGLLVDTFNIKGKVDGEIIKLLLECLLKDGDNANGFNFDEEIHDYYTNNIIKRFNHGDIIESGIGRNSILHGAHKSYGTFHNSLKIILLFDYIASAGSMIEKDKQQKGKTDIRNYRKNKNKRR